MASNNREGIKPPRELLVSWLTRLYSHRLTTTTGGNLSMVDDDGTMYITPSGGDKAIVPPENIAVREKGKNYFTGPALPSMEWPLHTAAYEARPDCRAVIHAHSMTLIAFSLAQKAEKDEEDGTADPRVPDTRVLLGAYQSCGKVMITHYAMPGSHELGGICKDAFAKGADSVILQNHGIVVVGKTLRDAYDRFVSIEYLARSIVNALPLNAPPKPLSPAILKYAYNIDSQDAENPFPRTIRALPYETTESRIVTGQEKEMRGRLCDFIHRAYNQNLVTSSSGSFSARIKIPDEVEGDVSFIISPSGVDRQSMEPADLCFVSTSSKDTVLAEEPDTKKAKLSPSSSLWFYPVHAPGDPQGASPSRASAVHNTIFRTHPDINFVIICQPPHATAYCITGLPFDSAGIPESHVLLRTVETLPFEAVLEDDGLALAKALDPSSGKTTVLVEGYGLVTVGKDLLKTYIQVEVCESMCGVTLTALRRGPATVLSKEELHAIDDAFKLH